MSKPIAAQGTPACAWHASSYAYSTLDLIKENVDNYRTNGIPLEGVWLDIKYMENYVDFTYDSVAFKGLPAYVEELHSKGIKVIPIVEAGLSADYADKPDDPRNKYFKMAKE